MTVCVLSVFVCVFCFFPLRCWSGSVASSCHIQDFNNLSLRVYRQVTTCTFLAVYHGKIIGFKLVLFLDVKYGFRTHAENRKNLITRKFSFSIDYNIKYHNTVSDRFIGILNEAFINQ